MQSGALVRWKPPVAGDELTIAPGVIVEDGDDLIFAESGAPGAILIIDGDDIEDATSGTVGAKLMTAGDDIILVEV
jgi:hypothetical protein